MIFRLTFIFIICSQTCFTQDKQFQDYIETIAQQEQRNLVDLVESYKKYIKHPLNLNSNNVEEFYNFPFFTSYQVSKILAYKTNLISFVDPRELRSLGLFTTDELHFILPLLTVKLKVSKAQQIPSYSLEQIFRTATIIEEQTGYKDKLLGSKPSYFFRNKQHWDNQLSFGLTIQKDAGEFLYNRSYSKGFDFLSASLSYKPKLKHLEKIVLGDYALNLGQGLILWNGFSMGKGVLSTQSNKYGSTLNSYHGSDELHFMRGTSATFKFNKFSLTPFVSSKKIDATIKEDSTISSISAVGYHRTINEIAKKENITELLYGSNLSYRDVNKKIGLQFVSQNYSIPFSYQPIYQQQYVKGQHLFYTSIDHSIIKNNWQLFGEFALDKNGNTAFIEGINYFATPNVSFNTTFRKYSPNYRSIYANSFGERNQANNEISVYNSCTINLGRQFQIKTYLDLYNFPSFSFSNNISILGKDLFSELHKSFSSNSSIYIRLKHENRRSSYEQNSLSRVRFHYKVKSNSFTFQSRIETSISDKSEFGFLLFQDIKSQLRKFTLNTRLAYFNTPGYASAIYAYQPNFLYAFRSLAYFNQGFQVLLMTKIHLSQQLKLWVKYQRVHFLNTDTVGSGYFETTTPHLSEVSCQIQFLL